MRKNVKDMTGQRFGMLTVIKYSKIKTPHGGAHWVCLCDCGRYVIVRGDNLRGGKTSRCTVCKPHRGGFPSVFCEEGEGRD